MSKQIRFSCIKDCSSYCCGGATIITIKEIEPLYKYFPITISFRKIYPFDNFHKRYLEDIAFRYRNFYIIGDFVAGNRMRRKCALLKNNLCSIHDIKPLQCRVIPFSVTFPEEYQNLVISQKKKEAFKYCKGFNEEFPLIWDSRFIDKTLKENFYKLEDYISQQREIFEKIFLSLDKTPTLDKFIFAEGGIFEIPLVFDFLMNIVSYVKINNIKEFIRIQKSLFIKDTMTNGMKNFLFVQALEVIEQMKDLTEHAKSYYD